VRGANVQSCTFVKPAIFNRFSIDPQKNETRNGQKAIAGFVHLPGRISNFFDD
jgi:hypothetical protein